MLKAQKPHNNDATEAVVLASIKRRIGYEYQGGSSDRADKHDRMEVEGEAQPGEITM